MDARTRELFRRWQSGDEATLGALIRDLQRTVTPLTVLLSDNVQHYRGLLDSENFRSDEEDEEDYEEEEDISAVDRSTEVDYMDFILPPGAQQVAGIYLRHTLGYILNNNAWLELLYSQRSSPSRSRGAFKKPSPAAARAYLKKVAGSSAKGGHSKAIIKRGKEIKSHLRIIAQTLMTWQPEYELVSHAILNYQQESVDPQLLAEYQRFIAATKSLNEIARELNLHQYRGGGLNDPMEAFRELLTNLASFLFVGRGHTLWLESIINNCNIIAANAGLTSDQLHEKCSADIVKAILFIDPNKVYEWHLTISVASEQFGLAEELARVRPILDTYPLEYPWSAGTVAPARPEGRTYEENEVEDDGYMGGPGYAFYTKYTGTVDALAEMRVSLVRDINTNRVDYMENTPWNILSSLVSS